MSTLAVAHDIPGRLRVRLPRRARTEGLHETIARVDGVTSCRWSPRARSLLVHYRRDTVTSDDLVDLVAAHTGVELSEPSPPSPGDNGSGTIPITGVVAGTVGALNQRIRRATAGRLNLALAVPIGLTLWAVFDVMRGPIRPLAWTTALWYAHGLFRDYALPDSHK